MPHHSIFQSSNNPPKSSIASTNAQIKSTNEANPSSKRSATSPAKGAIYKRSALGNITNAAVRKTNQSVQKPVFSYKLTQPQKDAEPKRRSIRLQTRTASSKPVPDIKPDVHSVCNDDCSSSSSQESTSSTISGVAAIEDVLEMSPMPTSYYEHVVPPPRSQLNYNDLDAANSGNVNEAPDYAFTIFEYTKARESCFVIQSEYLSTCQKELTPDMRAILVDWMVEVQENFELNHETLYLAVKLVDHHLQKENIVRERLQLVGATALLIAAKFDERHPPYVDDFLYICDDAYQRQDMLAMERSILTLIGFDLNIPISYRFLRRYAKCLKSNMEVLTLARFVLELSLQCYAMVDRSASHLAAATLWLSIKMKKSPHTWDDTMVYYTTRTEQDIFDLACELNAMVNESKQKKFKTIWQKYSHAIFYEVAKTSTLTNQEIEAERRRVFPESTVFNSDGTDLLEL